MNGPKKYRRVMVWMRRALHVHDSASPLHALQNAAEGVPFVCLREEFTRLLLPRSRKHLEARRSGRTGYPTMGAAMRKLTEEHRMHNRARMTFGSFLTKNLHVSWQEGERFFGEMLAGLGLVLNNGGWQWAAGTGTDASPWFRVVTPIPQGKKSDPGGSYVRSSVLKLRNVPIRFIHAPWEMSADDRRSAGCFPAKTYLRPIVDHAAERDVALKLYRTPRGLPRQYMSNPTREVPCVSF